MNYSNYYLSYRKLYLITLLTLLTLTYPTLSFADVQEQYYVSPFGDDNNTGTLEQPFKTISKARDAVRLINQNMTGDIIVNLAAGDYFLSQPLTLTELDSGMGVHTIIYKNQDEYGSARLIGGKRITGWEVHEQGIYKVNVSEGSNFNSLFVNGKRATSARYPNPDAQNPDASEKEKKSGYLNGYLTIHQQDNTQPRKAFNFKDENGIPTIQDISNLQIYIWPGGHINWANEILPITSIDSTAKKITLSEDQRWNYLGDLETGSRYFLQRALEFLDQPGEFYLDKNEDVLYYYPISSDINSEEIIAPTMTTVIEIKGSDTTTKLAKNIEINGLTIMVSDYSYTHLNKTTMGNIVVTNATDILITNNNIKNSALHGIALNGSATTVIHKISVTGNNIFNVGGSGIVAKGKGKTKNYTSTEHLISNNRIKDIAQISTNGAGIQIANVGNTTISHNRISKAIHYGIEVKGTKWQQILDEVTIDGVLVTENNKYDFNPGRYNVVEFNEVFNVNLDTQDTGAYKSGGNYITEINNNLFYNSGANFGIQKGIYLDDITDYSIVTNNIIYGISKSSKANPSINVKGIGNIVTNNIFHFDSTGMRLLEFKQQPTLNNVIERNIFYSTISNDIYSFTNRGYLNGYIESANYNLFYTPGNSIVKYIEKPAGGGFQGNLAGWLAFENNKFDQNSMVADPLFVDANNHNYTLQAGSPAFLLGFEQIDTANIGLKSTFVYATPTHEYTSMFSFTENFESNFDSWTTSLKGTPSLTTLQAHSGSQSYQLNEDTDQIGYELPEAKNALVSVWFYDDVNENSMKVKARVVDTNSSAQIGVVTYNSTNKYSFLVPGATFETSYVDRATGWHQFSFDLTSGTDCKLYIDGFLIATTTNITEVLQVVLGDGANDNKQGNVFFDDLSIITDVYDSFENGFDNWQVAQQGTASVSSNNASAGIYSYMVDEDRDQIGYELPQVVNGVVSVKFYDDASDESIKIKAMVADNSQNKAQIGVVTYKSTDKYSFLVEGTTFETSIVDRTTGWHQFSFDLTSGIDCKLYIDGILIATTANITEVLKVVLGDNASDNKQGNFYFDELLVSVEPLKSTN